MQVRGMAETLCAGLPPRMLQSGCAEVPQASDSLVMRTSLLLFLEDFIPTVFGKPLLSGGQAAHP
jgi:hypothetical protein